MVRLKNPATGACVNVDDDTAERLAGEGWVDARGGRASEAEPKGEAEEPAETEAVAEPEPASEAEPGKRKPGRPKKSE